MTSLRDYTPPEQIDAATTTVARWVISRLCDAEVVRDLWEDYPDLGESDWEAVVARVNVTALVNEPTAAEFERAYRFLASLAEGGAA